MTLKGVNILLIEDNNFILQDLKMSLTREGANVTTATSVLAGMSLVTRDFDVAILDIRLGDLDVTTIAEKLYEKNVPLIFHSALTDRDDVISAFPKAKALSKPVRESTLLEAVLESAKGT